MLKKIHCLFLLRCFLVLLQIVASITILNVLQSYYPLASTLNKRKWERALPLIKHLFVLFIYVLYAEKAKIEMFMICNLQCVDAAPALTTGNACPSRFFLFSFLFLFLTFVLFAGICFSSYMPFVKYPGITLLCAC